MSPPKKGDETTSGNSLEIVRYKMNQKERVRSPIHLLSLAEVFPDEVILLIFEKLHPVTSACFGLTCKKLYPIHRSLHGTVGLKRTVLGTWQGPHSPHLGELLGRWAGLELYYFEPLEKFVTNDQIGDFIEEVCLLPRPS
jgi:hypothetical protein